MPGFSKLTSRGPALLTCGTLLAASVAGAAERLIPFPTAGAEVPGHCMVVGGAAEGSGGYFKNSTRAEPMLAAGTALKKQVLESGALSRAEIDNLVADRSSRQERVDEFIERIGPAQRGQFHSDRVFDELDLHMADCTAWLANLGPTLPALPTDATSALDHCVMIAMSARALGEYEIAAANRGTAQRAIRNGGEVMTELTSSGRFKMVKERFAAPDGDLYRLSGDLVSALKMVRFKDGSPIKAVDPQTLALINMRLLQCHRKLGLQMPLQ